MVTELGYAGSRIHKISSTLSKVTGDGGGGGGGRGGGRGGGHSNSVFYSVKLCVMINFSLQHNVLCLSCTPSIAYMQLLKLGFSLMKEVVMCNKNLRLKSPFKVNRPLEFIKAP